MKENDQETDSSPRGAGECSSEPLRTAAVNQMPPATVTRTKVGNVPWKLWSGYGPLPDGFMRVTRIGPEYSGGIVTEPYSPDMMGTREDFEFIVRAVNAHAELVAALKALLHEVMESGNGTARDFGWPTAIGATRTALLKAEGRE